MGMDGKSASARNIQRLQHLPGTDLKASMTRRS